MTSKAEAPAAIEQRPSPESQAQQRESLVRALDINIDALEPKLRAAMEAMAAELIALRTERRDLMARLKSAESLADRDPLCEIFNRRAFERELMREIAQAERYGSALSVIFIDLDNFKAVNDQFGHNTGDDVIRHVADLLVSHLRQTDIVGRLGGDEFGIALTHADYQQAELKADALGEIIDSLQVRGQSAEDSTDTLVQLGASCGVVQWRGGVSVAALIAQADEAMFRAKCARKAQR